MRRIIHNKENPPIDQNLDINGKKLLLTRLLTDALMREQEKDRQERIQQSHKRSRVEMGVNETFTRQKIDAQQTLFFTMLTARFACESTQILERATLAHDEPQLKSDALNRQTDVSLARSRFSTWKSFAQDRSALKAQGWDLAEDAKADKADEEGFDMVSVPNFTA